MTKLVTSKKNIMKIEEFMTKYVGHTYDGDEKLTHSEMRDWLAMKGLPSLKRMSFDRISKEDILNGSCIIVKDKSGQRIPYHNPIMKSLDKLLEDLKKTNDPEKMRRVRNELLGELGYEEGYLGLIYEKMEEDLFPYEDEEITDKHNRTKSKKNLRSRGK